MPLGLELLAGLAPFLPGFRIFLRPKADFVPPRGAVGDLQADNRVRDGKPFLAVEGDRLGGFVIAALRLADLLGDVADIDDAFGIELRPVVDRADDVGTGAGRDGGSNPRLDRQAIDGFEVELDAEVLLALLDDLASERLVGDRHIIGPSDPVQRRALGKSRRPPRGENPGESAARRRSARRRWKAGASGAEWWTASLLPLSGLLGFFLPYQIIATRVAHLAGAYRAASYRFDRNTDLDTRRCSAPLVAGVGAKRIASWPCGPTVPS